MKLRALTTAALLVAACSGSGGSSSGSPDASAPADAGRPEGSTPIPSEGGPPPPSVPSTFCGGQSVTFCDDFDTPSVTAKAWSINDSKGTGGSGLPAGGLDTVNHTSAPNAFVARTAALAGGAFELLQLQGSSLPPAGKSHVDADFAFSVRIGALGSASKVEIARIEGVNPINFASYGLALVVAGSGASLELVQGAKAVVVQPLAAAPATGSWTRITIHLGMELVVNGAQVPITIQVGTAPAEAFSLDRGMGVRPFYRLGVKVAGPADPVEVTYDDVIYDAK